MEDGVAASVFGEEIEYPMVPMMSGFWWNPPSLTPPTRVLKR